MLHFCDTFISFLTLSDLMFYILFFIAFIAFGQEVKKHTKVVCRNRNTTWVLLATNPNDSNLKDYPLLLKYFQLQ